MGYQQLYNPIEVQWRWHCHLQRCSKGKIIGISNIKIGISLLIENIALVVGFKHNLLSISQLGDKGLKVIFDDSTCDVIDKKNDSRVLSDFRENNVISLMYWI